MHRLSIYCINFAIPYVGNVDEDGIQTAKFMLEIGICEMQFIFSKFVNKYHDSF